MAQVLLHGFDHSLVSQLPQKIVLRDGLAFDLLSVDQQLESELQSMNVVLVENAGVLNTLNKEHPTLLICFDSSIWHECLSSNFAEDSYLLSDLESDNIRKWLVNLIQKKLEVQQFNQLLQFKDELIKEEIDKRLSLVSSQKEVFTHLFNALIHAQRSHLFEQQLVSSPLKDLLIEALTKIDRLAQTKTLQADINIFAQCICTYDYHIAIKALEVLFLELINRLSKNARISIATEIRDHSVLLIFRIQESDLVDKYIFTPIFEDKDGDESTIYHLFDYANIQPSELIDDFGNHELYLKFTQANDEKLDKTSTEKTVHKNPSTNHPFKDKCILITDDNDLNLMIITKQLEDAGAKVYAFEDPLDTLAWAEENTYDLALIDIKMPHMDGYALSKKLQRINSIEGSNALICLCTAYPSEVNLQKMHQSGIKEVIGKPININNLESILSKHTLT